MAPKREVKCVLLLFLGVQDISDLRLRVGHCHAKLIFAVDLGQERSDSNSYLYTTHFI